MNYYIADMHFGHTAVLHFDGRPFANIEEMEKSLIENWNTVVTPQDTVYILGDFCWNKADDWLRILRKLKGNKVLVEGNHDLKTYPPELRKEFSDIKSYKEVMDEGRKVILSHYPILFYKHSNDPSHYMLCGHVHRTQENYYLQKWIAELRSETADNNTVHFRNCGQIYNVGCMMPWMQYTPQSLSQILQNYEAEMSRNIYPPSFYLNK